MNSPKVYEASTDKTKKRNSSTVTTGDFKIPLSIIERTPRQSVRKERT